MGQNKEQFAAQVLDRWALLLAISAATSSCDSTNHQSGGL